MHTHTRTGPGRGVLRPARGGVGVHTKQPRCTSRVPSRTTDGTGNRTRIHPVKPGAQAPGVGKGTTASGKHRERPDRTRRGTPRGATRHVREARRRPQPRHTDRCQATTAAGCRKPGERAQHAPHHGTGTGAKQHQLPGAPGGYPAPTGYEQPPSGWTSVRPEGAQPLPATNSRRLDGRVRARRAPSPYRQRTAAVQMDE